MRDIKFRAWDKRVEIMIQNDLLVEGGRQLVIFAKRMRPNMPDMENAKGGLLLPTDDENMVFMQYTGLKDKNGKEIYEGDIIRSYNIFGDSFAVLSVVAWDENKTGYTGIITHELHLEEVIGNIYENPELLEVQA